MLFSKEKEVYIYETDPVIILVQFKYYSSKVKLLNFLYKDELRLIMHLWLHFISLQSDN